MKEVDKILKPEVDIEVKICDFLRTLGFNSMLALCDVLEVDTNYFKDCGEDWIDWVEDIRDYLSEALIKLLKKDGT